MILRMRQRAASLVGGQREGFVLLTVLVAIALITILVTEFVYSSRVKLALATNARDEAKAYYNARSGVNLLRLALTFQYELQDEGDLIGQAIDRSNFQLWQYLDLFLPTFVSARVDSPVGSLDLADTGAIGFGNLEGEIIFHDPVPEEGKINLNAFSGTVLEQAALFELCALFAPASYDVFFEDGAEDSQLGRERPTRGELIGAIIDHIDSDSDLIEVDENCQVVPAGAGAEERRYRDLDYEAKNEPFTTLDEVLLVPGFTPELLELFRDNLTVYAVAQRFYPNLADAQGFMGFLCANVIGNSEQYNACRNPLIASQIAYISLAMEGWRRFFENPFMLLDYYLGLSSGQSQTRVAEGIAQGQMIAFRRDRDFLTVLDLFVNNPETAAQYAILADPQRALLLGLVSSGGQAAAPPRFNVLFDEGAIQQRVSVETPRVFTISATGQYGLATRTITAVVDFTQDGRMLYWREY